MNKMRYTGLGVHIKVADIQASRAFYEALLEFVPVFGYGDEAFRKTLPEAIPSVLDDGLPGAPEKYHGVTYEPTPQSPLEIADGHIAVPDATVFSSPVPSPKISAMLKADSLVPLILGKGVRPTFPVRHYYWGTLELALKDPDGFVVIVIAPYAEEEFKMLQEAIPVEVVSP